MPDYISREAVGTLLRDTRDMTGDQKCLLYQRVKAIPAADVAQVRRGVWNQELVTRFESNGASGCSWNETTYICSVCGRTEKAKEPYCHCGAKMDAAWNAANPKEEAK